MHILLIGPCDIRSLEKIVDFPPVKSMGYSNPIIPNLVLEYIKMGHKVSVITSATDISEKITIEVPNLSFTVIPSSPRARKRALSFYCNEIIAIKNEIERINPEIIHAHWMYEFAAGSLISNPKRTLITAHDDPFTVVRDQFDAYRILRTLIAIWVRIRLKYISAPSPYLASKLRSHLLIKRKIFVVTNPIQDPLLGAKKRRKILVNGPHLVTISNYAKFKNLEILVSALAIIKLKFPKVRLTVIGHGIANNESLLSICEKNGIKRNVKLIDYSSREEINTLLQESDVMCHPSLRETQSMAVVEGMLAKLPIVAGRKSGAIPWTTFDGIGANLVDVKNPQEIAEAVCDILSNPKSSRIRVGVAREMCLSRYSPQVVATEYLKIYNHILEQLHR